MITAEQNLQETLEEVKQQVRSQPAEPKHRLFLFQLFAILGKWDKALTQLNVFGEMDEANLGLMHVYRRAIECEAARSAILRGTARPVLFGEPAAWAASLVEAVRLESQRESTAARQLRESAFAEAETSSGTLIDASGESHEFSWIADADSRFGPMLEAIVDGKYYWVPWTHVLQLDIEAPTDLRDLIWLPVQFTWTTGGQSAGFIPTRYVGSGDQDDDAIRTSRRTEWTELPSAAYAGLGQRMLTTDQADFALLDVRQVRLDNKVSSEATQVDNSATAELTLTSEFHDG